ncbi:hypothetical protein EKO04_006743 [Ascochyta lentis]|uniref:Uncharacterized protein n=1 Tax=Ascochyta lentis TaxID=205686 RepID=A0A8H7J2D7_9PLEO|nr:hypothetical protein EKO04_006743 [Ascochyta lentis]
MAGFIQNILWNSVEGFVDAAKKTGGEYAGNALIKAGDMIEGGGRSVGNGIEKTATGYGSKLSGQTYQASSASKALPSTARKPAVKRSNSMPANTKPSGSVAGGRSIAGPTSGVPLGAKKTVGGAKKAVGGVAGGATKTVGGVTGGVTKTAGGVVGGANKAVGGVTGGATRGVNGVVGGASKGVSGVAGRASKPVGGLVNNATQGVNGITGGASKPLGGVVNNATKGVGGIVNGASKPINGIGSNAQKAVPQGMPKPYNSTTAGSSYTNPYPTAKKAAVKPGMSKSFTPPASNASEPKPYPGTNTLPGQGSKTPVKRTCKPAQTLGSQVAPGQKMTHIGAF